MGKSGENKPTQDGIVHLLGSYLQKTIYQSEDRRKIRKIEAGWPIHPIPSHDIFL